MTEPTRAPHSDPLLKATRLITAATALSLDSMKPSLSLSEVRALNIIESSGPLNLAALAEGLGVAPSSASRTSDRLVSRGLVRRTVDKEDRRNVSLAVTAAGRRGLDRMMTTRRAILQQVIDHMSADDQAAFDRAMAAFAAAADELEERGEFLSDTRGHLLRWLG